MVGHHVHEAGYARGATEELALCNLLRGGAAKRGGAPAEADSGILDPGDGAAGADAVENAASMRLGQAIELGAGRLRRQTG